MKSSYTTVAGCVRLKGKGQAGIRVRLLDEQTHQSIAETFTDEHGEYRARLLSDQFQGEKLKLKVEAFDASGRSLVRSKRLSVAPFEESVANLTIGSKSFPIVKPVLRPLEPHSGSLVEPKVYERIEAAIGMLQRPGTPAYSQMVNWAKCPRPFIDLTGNVLQNAWDVINGIPDAIPRFRRVLDLIDPPGLELPNVPQVQKMVSAGASCQCSELPDFGDVEPAPIQMSQLMELPQSGGTISIPSGSLAETRCAIPFDRFAPVAMAAMLSSYNMTELNQVMDTLDRSLCGLDRLHHLWEAAEHALATGDGEYFGATYNRIIIDCGPDDGPAPRPPRPKGPKCPPVRKFPDLERCVTIYRKCLREFHAHLQERFRYGWISHYTIQSITPNHACPGDRIRIHGTGFGTLAGNVCFYAPGTGTTCVRARKWTDTEIEVVVPPGTGDTQVSLSIKEDVVRLCDWMVSTKRRGNSKRLKGGAAKVSSLTVNNETSNICLEPHTLTTIRWAATAGSQATITVKRNGTQVLRKDKLAPTGSLLYRTPRDKQDTHYTVTVDVQGACESDSRTIGFVVTVIPSLRIEGIEVTQGVQRYWRPGVTWNSLPTIAGKDTIARVYISCDRKGFANDEMDRVTGSLKIGNTTLLPINGQSPNAAANAPNQFITARRRSDIRRDQTNHTLNFRIPASLASGNQTLRVQVGGRFKPCDKVIATTRNQAHGWQTNQALKVRFVRIRDNRPAPNGGNTIPTAAAARFTVQRAFDLLPSPATDIGPARRETWTTARDFTTTAGLELLLSDLNDEHHCSIWEMFMTLFGLDDCPGDDQAKWMGLTEPFNRGMAYVPGNTCMSAIYEVADGSNSILRVKTAHELGHNLGLCHDQAGNPAKPCANEGTAADVPFDPFWNLAITGNVTDFMGYGARRWTSEGKWNDLINRI